VTGDADRSTETDRDGTDSASGRADGADRTEPHPREATDGGVDGATNGHHAGQVRTATGDGPGGGRDGSTAAAAAGDAQARAADGCPFAEPPHPAADLLSLLGKAHAMRVLGTLAHRDPRAWRFSELETELDVSPNTLSARLSEFQDAGLVTRTTYDEIPPRVEYEATDRARELDPVFRELHAWMDRHGRPTDG
jgi:DNA-binding HxlR family transcriptional regulator